MSLTLPRTGMPTPMVLSTMSDELTQLPSWTATVGASGAWPTALMAYFYPVRITDTRTYNKAWWLNGATAAGNVDVGIYTISGATATRVVACTAEAQGTISVIQVATTFTATTLTPGLYYLAMSCSLATSTMWRVPIGVTPAKTLGIYQAATSHPLPSTPTVITPAAGNIPVFGFTELSIV